MSEALRIGVAGLGTVGTSVVHLLQERFEQLQKKSGRLIKVVAVSARDQKRERGIDLNGVKWFDNPVELASFSDIDVFVELIGGDSGAAKDAVETALKAGHHVVTANKALLACHGIELAKIAEEKGLFLNFEAAVAGGIPIIKVLRESLSANKINRLYGILNGTCNYILTRMEEEGLSFADCLKDAQRLGYAEEDPTFDIEGNDTAHKLAILTSIAFGTSISLDDIYLEGISNISQADIRAASDLGYRIKLLGVAVKTETGIEQRVHPTMVPADSVIAQVQGVINAVSVNTDLLGDLLLSGPGAGGNATASSVVADIVDIAKAKPGVQNSPVFGVLTSDLKPYTKAQMRSHDGGYFIRLTVCDKAGVFASVAKRMADNGISLESIVQRPQGTEHTPGTKTIILVTHETTEVAVRKALLAITDDDNLIDKPQLIRIERPV